MLGFKPGTARRKWDRIIAEGWKGAIDKRKAKLVPRTMSDRGEFIEFWRALCEKHGRSCKAAWHDLLVMWRGYVPIPGYEDFGGHPPEHGKTGLPRGWTYPNLMHFAPSTEELVLGRIGRKTLQAKTTGLWTTRVGLSCGMCYQFDDVWEDVKVFLGKRLVRPMELGCIDLFSTRRVLFGLAPRLANETGKEMGLKENYMLWLTLALLMETGYHPQQCSLIVEHRTAALPGWFEKNLFDASNKIIRVDRSGIQDKPALLGWWAGEGGGNPRMKSCLESLHGYYHNRFGLLPAQTGSNSRLNLPEELTAIEKYSEQVAKELSNFRPDKIDRMLGMLRLPAMTWQQYQMLKHEFYTVIDGRTDHNLEGWDRAGLITTQFRLKEDSQEWEDVDALARMDPQQYAAVKAWLDSNDKLIRPARMSPLEVWERRQGTLKRIPRFAINQLLGEDLAREVKVSGHTIEFADAQIEPDGLKFEAAVEEITGHKLLLKSGESYNAYINPLAPNVLHICDSRFRYLGAANRIFRESRVNRGDIFKAIGTDAARLNERMSGFRARHAGEANEHQEMLAHNRHILSGAPVLDEEIETAQIIRDTRVTAGDRDAATEHGDLVPAIADDGKEEFSAADIAELLRTDR